MTAIRGYHMGPRLLAALFVMLVVALFGEVGLVVWTYEQSQTQHQICQAFGFVGDQIQHGIDTNSKIVTLDDAQGKTKDASIRRAAIKQSTDFLIRVQRVQC